LVTVTPDLVRDRVDLSSTDIDDTTVTDFIKDAEATIEEETGVSIDYTNCSQAEAAAFKSLAAMRAQGYGSVPSVLIDTLLFLAFSRFR